MAGLKLAFVACPRCAAFGPGVQRDLSSWTAAFCNAWLSNKPHHRTWTAFMGLLLLSMERLFRSDFEDGVLEPLLLRPHPLPLFVLTKRFAGDRAMGAAGVHTRVGVDVIAVGDGGGSEDQRGLETEGAVW